jgi:integrase
MTRYPKAGKGHKWTIRELNTISSNWKGDTLSDGGGLVGEVRAADGTVSVAFRYGFKWQGKKAWFYCGTYPAVDLTDIRARRDEAKRQVAAGVNPNDKKQADRIEAQKALELTIAQAKREEAENKTVLDLFDAWVTDGVSRADGNAGIQRAFNRDVLPDLGGIAIRELTDIDIKNCLAKVGRGRGKGRAAELLLADVRQMFRWADKRQPWRGLLIDGNPAELVEPKHVTPQGYERVERDRVLSPDEIRELRDIFASMDVAYNVAPDRRVAVRPVQQTTQLALWLCLGTMCRIGELLKARWEHVDLEAATWFVPSENTKTRADWMVFLSPFALRQFKALKKLTGESVFCFPAKHGLTYVCDKSVSKQIGDRQTRFKQRKPLKNRRNDNSLVLSGGKNGEWTPHDLRRTGATMMQKLGVPLDIIDRCQNHVLAGSRVRRHYLHHDYAKEKRGAWERLGAELDQVLS